MPRLDILALWVGPALGRMLQVDPLSSKYGSLTPYNYAANDPVYWNDPSGADYEWASMGGCGCWKDDGPQDYGGEARGGMYGFLANPGFGNAGTWSMIVNAWNSMAGISNGIGTWEYSDGEQMGDPGIVDLNRGTIVSGNFGTDDWRVAAGMLVTEVMVMCQKV